MGTAVRRTRAVDAGGVEIATPLLDWGHYSLLSPWETRPSGSSTYDGDAVLGEILVRLASWGERGRSRDGRGRRMVGRRGEGVEVELRTVVSAGPGPAWSLSRSVTERERGNYVFATRLP